MSSKSDNYYALQYESLLDHFRRPDGYRWSNTEIAQASEGLLSPQYLGQLANGKFIRPGAAQLQTIAEVMGFPARLWYLQPTEWPSELYKQQDNSAVLDELLETLSDAELRQLLRQWRTLSAGHRAAVLNLVSTLNNMDVGP